MWEMWITGFSSVAYLQHSDVVRGCLTKGENTSSIE
jgi:hypothetical protein